MKPTRTWILIADGARARIFANFGPGKGIEAVDGTEFETDHPQSSDYYTDKPGRSFESANTMRHAMEPPHDPHREAKRAFAVKLGKVLSERLSQKEYDRLIIVAPPASLGDLRATLSDDVQAVVSAELDKDLTKTPVADLPKHLESVLAV